MDLAARIVAIVLGFIAAVAVYPFFNAYVVAILALLGAIAVGVLVFGLVDRLLGNFTTRTRY